MSKHVEFVDEGPSASGKTMTRSVRSKSGGDLLGLISWYGPWRQYVFQPQPQTVFSHDCMLSISRYCYSLNQQQKNRDVRERQP